MEQETQNSQKKCIGGMFDIMKLVNLTLLVKLEEQTFERKDLCGQFDISSQAISNNLKRLEKLGFIEKVIDTKNINGHTVKYKINGDKIESICNSIFN